MRISKPSAVAAMLPISNLRADADIVMCSAFGMVKRAPLGMFAKITRAGVTAMGLQVRIHLL
jgi:DNA gyrase/topoisomerase IV subunit A